jgi:trehalose 6-phosphate synthase/phosphatase
MERQRQTISSEAGDRQIARPEPALDSLLAELVATKPIRLLLDYDGTLVPIARSPELATPDQEVRSLLASLVEAAPHIRTAIVSGRSRETLEGWFGSLPLSLWAEHGFWHRPSPRLPWQAAAPIPSELRAVQSILEHFAADTPGAQVEVKSASLAWHYRQADRQFGARQAHELRMLLGDALRDQPFEIIEGKKVIEVRLRGVSKGLVACRLLAERDPDVVLVAIGDDRTDEDLFRALPPSSITVAVGSRPTNARFRVGDYSAVRRLLRSVAIAPVRRG